MSTYSPQPPYTTIEEEFEARTRKAFVDNGAKAVVIYSRHQRFQSEMIAHCQRQGWLDNGSLVELDEQSTEYRYALTEDGRKHFFDMPMCRGCKKPLFAANVTMADGCPCNTPKGVNHGLVDVRTCTCEVCDQEQTGCSRNR